MHIPDPSEVHILVFFDAKKAFDTVWHIGLLHKAIKDGLPGRIIRFLLTWLSNRALRLHVGQTLSKPVSLNSGVPQGSVLAPLTWNYYTGDVPTTKSSHSSTTVYEDDASTATSHCIMEQAVQIAQEEIWQLNNWTLRSRIKFDPKKMNVPAIHRNPTTRNLLKENTIYTWTEPNSYCYNGQNMQNYLGLHSQKMEPSISTWQKLPGKASPEFDNCIHLLALSKEIHCTECTSSVHQLSFMGQK